MPARFPRATVVRLEENYRSTPQVLAFANRLVPQLGGAEKTLRSVRPDGPEPVVAPFATPEDEGAAVVGHIRELDCPLEEIAILARTNARLADFEELLHDSGIPFQGASLLDREAARRLARRLERSGGEAAEGVRTAALDAGWLPHPPDRLGERELVRQADLARLVSMAAAFDGDAASFVAELRRRYDPGGDGAQGVHLLTLHRAKGLEFEAVFLPRLQERELPSRLARSEAEIAEERRLFYVGLTRAKRVLWVSWAGKRSRFVNELALREPRAACAWSETGEKLRAWRLERARTEGVPPYVVFHDRVLHLIADAKPSSLGELSQIPGVGPAKLERYGPELLTLVES
jgi:DNA helicase-2/ATP-dependent DNA helicase PcrA